MEKILCNIYQPTASFARRFLLLGNFYFNKNKKLLASIVSNFENQTIKIGLNFDRCRLKDCTSWEKYKNILCDSISVSSYGLMHRKNKFIKISLTSQPLLDRALHFSDFQYF